MVHTKTAPVHRDEPDQNPKLDGETPKLIALRWPPKRAEKRLSAGQTPDPERQPSRISLDMAPQRLQLKSQRVHEGHPSARGGPR